MARKTKRLEAGKDLNASSVFLTASSPTKNVIRSDSNEERFRREEGIPIKGKY
jgi:hypothetical protein